MHPTSMVSRPASRLRGLTQGRLVYVEDDAFAAALVEATLEDAGVEVHWVSNGRSALTAAGAERYDACVIGVGPRDMGRVELAEELARLDHAVPIIVIADRREDLSMFPNVTVVRSPFASRALVGAVHAVLDANRVAA